MELFYVTNKRWILCVREREHDIFTKEGPSGPDIHGSCPTR